MRRILIITLSTLAVVCISLFAVFSCSGPTGSSAFTPGDGWRTVYEPLTTATVQGISYSGHEFVAVGSGGAVLRSTDGASWETVASGAIGTTSLIDIEWIDGRFIAVGSAGAIFQSPDGLSWKQAERPTERSLLSIASNGESVVIVDNQGDIYFADEVGHIDGGLTLADWPRSPHSLTRGVAWTGDKYVAVGVRGRILYSETGREWQVGQEGRLGVVLLEAAAGSGAMIVAVGRRSGYRSVDGMNWVEDSTLGAHNFHDIVWTGQRFVAVGDGVSANSVDGVNWSVVPACGRCRIIAVTDAGDQLVSVGSAGVILRSVSGETWETISDPISRRFVDLIWGDNEFVAIGKSGFSLVSTNGAVWTPSKHTDSLDWTSLTWSGSQYVAVGDGISVATSPDGQSWTFHPLGVRARFTSVAFSGTQYVAVGSSAMIAYSPDGRVWDTTGAASSPLLYDVVHGASRWVAVGSNSRSGTGTGIAISSADGINWTAPDTLTDQRIMAVAWSGTEFLAAGDAGAMFTSPDGVSWTLARQFFGYGFGVRDVIWADNQYIVVGYPGLVVTTDDLENWINLNQGDRTGFNRVAWNGRRLVAIDGGFTVLSSP